MFSGVGGFELGLQNASKEFECVGFSEIDKYASIVLKKRFKGVKNYGNAKTINAERLPDFDLLVGGFPCPSFSIAGKRKGFDDERGTLFFEIVKVLKAKRPRLVLLENVKGLLSHNEGGTFGKILNELDELGYWVEWQVLNSKDFGVPQNRERVFIVGHLGRECSRQVFPITEGDSINAEKRENNEGQEVCWALRSRDYKDGTNFVVENQLKQVGIIGDDSEATRVYSIDGIARTIKDGGGMGAKTGLYAVGFSSSQRKHGVESRVKVGEFNALTGSQNSRKSANYVVGKRIRRLTPIECERLQGFPDDWTLVELPNGKMMSDSQRYKMMGNAVTTNVITAIGKRLIE